MNHVTSSSSKWMNDPWVPVKRPKHMNTCEVMRRLRPSSHYCHISIMFSTFLFHDVFLSSCVSWPWTQMNYFKVFMLQIQHLAYNTKCYCKTSQTAKLELHLLCSPHVCHVVPQLERELCARAPALWDFTFVNNYFRKHNYWMMPGGGICCLFLCWARVESVSTT